jgi:tRNA dimethylallyltransferase
MIQEAKGLRARLSKKRYLELGFEFLLLAEYLDKKISKQELVDLLVRGEEKYAKRQMRWFKRNKDIRWVKNKSEALRLAKAFISG